MSNDQPGPSDCIKKAIVSSKRSETVQQSIQPKSTLKRKLPNVPNTSRKIPKSTEKTKRFVTLTAMHNENIAILKKIDHNIELMSNSLINVNESLMNINKNIQRYVECVMQETAEDDP